MRLYTRTGATALDDPEFGHFEAADDGSFLLPEELAERLRRFRADKQPLWETDIERQHRLKTEELERRKDPATLLAAVEQLVNAAHATTTTTVEAAPAAKPARARRSATTSE